MPEETGQPANGSFPPTQVQPATATPWPPPAAVGTSHSASPLRVAQTTDVSLSGGSSRFDYQSIDPQTGLLFIAHLGASMVHVFDVRAGQPRADIPDVSSVHGVLAVPELGRVYASATGDNQVAVIDEKTLRVVGHIEGGDYPDGLAYVPAYHKLYVSDEAGRTDTVIDTTSNRRVGIVDLGGEAGNTQFDPVSGAVFVAVQTRNQLVAIDPATDEISGRYGLPGCEHDHGLLIDAPQRRAFVACDGNAKLLLLDLGSMQVLDTQSVGEDPDVLALDSNWHWLFVAAESGDLSIFDEHGGRLHKVYAGPFAPAAHTVAVDSQTHRVYFPLQAVNGQPALRIVSFSAP